MKMKLGESDIHNLILKGVQRKRKPSLVNRVL